MITGVSDFFAQAMERHEAEVAEGKHDGRCEYETGCYLCNCAKRRRQADGVTTVPTEDLDFPPPSCPRCDRYLNHDGDGWQCSPCALAWASDGAGSSCRFTDDHGDLTRCRPHQRRACLTCRTAKDGER